MKKLSFKPDAADACRKVSLPAKRRGSGAGKGCPGTEGLVAHGFVCLSDPHTHTPQGEGGLRDLWRK